MPALPQFSLLDEDHACADRIAPDTLENRPQTGLQTRAYISSAVVAKRPRVRHGTLPHPVRDHHIAGSKEAILLVVVVLVERPPRDAGA